MQTAYLGLGSNVGEQASNIIQAIDILSKKNNIIIKQTSSLYKTTPLGASKAKYYNNAVIKVATSLTPLEMLYCLQFIEKQFNRTVSKRWSDRVIDIDILNFTDVNLKFEVLSLPHPQMQYRKFVLIPLHEIAPEHFIFSEVTEKMLLQENGDVVRLGQALEIGS